MSLPRSRPPFISRRGLIGSGAAASVLAATGLAQAAPHPGGTLRIAVGTGALFDRVIAPGAVFDCLTEIDDAGRLRGELAESWSASAGGQEWVVGLRSDIAFHDGRPFRAADVVASLRPLVGRADALAGVRGMRCSGKEQVVFALVAADPQFPLRLSDPDLVIRPGGDPAATTGTGLYRVVETGPGARVKLARYEGHPRSGRGGHFDRVELLELAAPADRVDALTSGRVDLAFDLPREAGPVLARIRRYALAELVLPGNARPVRVGHIRRLRGMDGRDPLRIAERGFFA